MQSFGVLRSQNASKLPEHELHNGFSATPVLHPYTPWEFMVLRAAIDFLDETALRAT
jgi:hypothetical protein